MVDRDNGGGGDVEILGVGEDSAKFGLGRSEHGL